jgi:hypothetical protein
MAMDSTSLRSKIFGKIVCGLNTQTALVLIVYPMWFNDYPTICCSFIRYYKATSQVPVAHTCNSSFSGGRDQKDCGSKPAWTNSL